MFVKNIYDKWILRKEIYMRVVNGVFIERNNFILFNDNKIFYK